MTTLLRQGLRRYVPEDRLRRLQELRLGIAGLGGIGSNVAFMLARTGFSRFVLVDEDTVEPSNLNRQFYFPADVGQSKVAALTRHLHELDPGLQIEGLVERVADSTLPRLLPKADFWIEALDGADMKQRLVQACLLATKPVVACSGMGGFGGPQMTVRRLGLLSVVGDFASDVEHCAPLAPRVVACAALMADEVLCRVWQTKD